MHGLPALVRASHYPAIDVQAFQKAALATGKTGWHGRDRTSDRAVNSRLLYRWSYDGEFQAIKNPAQWPGFEVVVRWR